MPGPCDAACQHSEEECTTCLLQQYMSGYATEKEAVESLYAHHRIDQKTRTDVLRRLEETESVLRKGIAGSKS